MNQLTRNIPSTEVAEMVGRDHNEVLKDIRRIINQLGEGNLPQSYFIESTYTNTQNKELPCFLLTKKGCELYGTRMTGEKGTQFAVQYIERFNEMEEQVINQTNLPQDPITLALEAALETRKTVQTIQTEVKEVKADIEELRDNLHITSSQAKVIRKKVAEKVYEALGGKESNAYKHLNKKLFSACWGEFKDYFDINEFRDLPKNKFEDGMKFLFMWQPRTEMRLEIEHYNTQLQLKLVK
ncbi:Rha family transcriptional regulator [Lysinibacillus fusiformis]|uniref:Rha family transcriptional regulator n=1 Tax=Lysinibacillus fusiformis TaxID=28031 RepID=UPI0018802EB5|nr:Rha family transcriptional regulator [Lysinibacillus fusiformis]MBD8522384.1 ORF6C domain-containing protein [Lysinibacillus fusiformis]